MKFNDHYRQLCKTLGMDLRFLGWITCKIPSRDGLIGTAVAVIQDDDLFDVVQADGDLQMVTGARPTPRYCRS